MESFDLIIKNGMVMVAGDPQRANLLISAEKIAGIVASDILPKGREAIDAAE